MLKFVGEDNNDVYTYYVNRLHLSFDDDRQDVHYYDPLLMETLNDYEGRSENARRENAYETRDPAQALDVYFDMLNECGHYQNGSRHYFVGVEIEKFSIDRGTSLVRYAFHKPAYRSTVNIVTSSFAPMSQDRDGRTFVSVVDMITGDHMQTTCKTLRAAKAWATKTAEKIAAKYTLIAGRDDVRFEYHRDFTGLTR